MDHLDAEQVKAVERYVLGDLTVSEVEEFERHFFDCPQCSEELRTLTIFQENAHAVFLEQDPAPIAVRAPVPESAASWWSGVSPPWSWAAALAAMLIGICGGALGYGAFASRENAQAVAAYPLYGQARGEETVVSPAAGSKFYTLYLDRTWDGDFASYKAVLLNASGGEKFSLPVKAGAPGQAIHILVPSHKLTAGRYVLVMQGSGIDKEQEVARFPFTLRFE